MANSYKPGKWSGVLKATIQGDATKTTPTLGFDYDIELENLKTAQSNIKDLCEKIGKEISALKNDSETGKMATDYLQRTEKQITKLIGEMDSAISGVEKQITTAARAEQKRFKELLEKWAASQQDTDTTEKIEG